MTHYSFISDAVFQKIAKGERRIEPRLNDHDHRQIILSDLIVFTNRDTAATIRAHVVGILRYEHFEHLFAAFPIHYFGVESLDELRAEIANWSTPVREVRYGVLGLKLHVLRN